MSDHEGTAADGFKAYLLFSLGEVFCVFLPVLVHLLVVALMNEGDHESLFDQPDLLYAAIVLPGLAAAKYLLAFISTRRQGVRGARLLARLMFAGLIVILSAILLGMFFHTPHHSTLWWALEIGLALISIAIFLVASSDYHALVHH